MRYQTLFPAVGVPSYPFPQCLQVGEVALYVNLTYVSASPQNPADVTDVIVAMAVRGLTRVA